MARGRRAALSSTASKKSVTHVSVVHPTSIAATRRRDSISVQVEAARVGGKDLLKTVRVTSANTAARELQQNHPFRLRASASDISFWKGLFQPTLLAHALANIGTLVEPDLGLPSVYSQPRYPFSALSVERLETAMQAVVDAAALLQLSERTEEEDNKNDCDGAQRKRWKLVHMLIQLAETAVPMKKSALQFFVSEGDNSVLTTPPTSMWALRQRLRQLQRLYQLRKCHMQFIPSLFLCKTKEDIAIALFGPSTGRRNTVEVMCEEPSWHQREVQEIKCLMNQVNDTGLSKETWGEPFAPPLHVINGSIILHRQSRMDVLAHVLNAAEFCGLPPFLRSLRIGGGRRWSLSHQPIKCISATPILPAEESPPSLFPSPSDLNPQYYNVPEASQVEIVQNELIDLTCQYCRIGILVGEADQVVTLLCTSARRWRHANAVRNNNTQGTVVKPEQQDDDMLPTPTANVSDNVLHSYAQYLSRSSCKEYMSNERVHWLCDNRWHPTMSYYAIVIVALLQHSYGEELEVLETKADASLYYVAGILQISRL